MAKFICPFCKKENYRIICNSCGSLWNLSKNGAISFDKKNNKARNCPGCGKGISTCYVACDDEVKEKHKDHNKLMSGETYREHMPLSIDKIIKCDYCSKEFKT